MDDSVEFNEVRLAYIPLLRYTQTETLQIPSYDVTPSGITSIIAVSREL